MCNQQNLRSACTYAQSDPELSLGIWKQEFRTPIWQKVGVPLEKWESYSKKLESHQFVHSVYLFHFSRKWYIWIIFRSTDFNPLSINWLFLLNKNKIFWYYIFSCNLNTHFFVWPYQNKRLNCWYCFHSLTRQTDRQADRQTDSSPLFCIILCRWKCLFF